jgi:predicted nucleic acid-binding protein
MVVYFCDTSAIVKRYVNEPGTTWLIGVTDRTGGNRTLVAAITGVEAVAAITRRQRGGGLTLTDAAAACAAFRHDYANEFGIVAITPKLITLAMSCAEKHGLRGYDAMQLAAALVAHERRQASKLPPLTLLSADGELNTAATAEGLVVEDPNAHP